jgi:RNA polymerase sigma-70 factor (ECF subfamily)
MDATGKLKPRWGSVEELFRAEFARLVRNLALVDGPEAAADAVQEAFIRADRQWREVQAMADPAAWVRRVALNRLLNGRRNHRRRTAILAAVRGVADVELAPLDFDLLAAIRRLPRQQRLALCLHHFGGPAVDEVAEDLGVSPGTVKRQLHDARNALRRCPEVAGDVL